MNLIGHQIVAHARRVSILMREARVHAILMREARVHEQRLEEIRAAFVLGRRTAQIRARRRCDAEQSDGTRATVLARLRRLRNLVVVDRSAEIVAVHAEMEPQIFVFVAREHDSMEFYPEQ